VTHHDATELQPALESCLGYVQNTFVDLEFGGWFTEPSPKPGSPGEHKGSEWKMDYHVVGMCVEGL
jgi:mannose/cellobiose epimerase-like protein (N-acyl-D-glucosamine 2-epimerase family)